MQLKLYTAINNNSVGNGVAYKFTGGILWLSTA